MKKQVARLLNDTDGQDLIEYALLTACLAIGCLSAMTSFGDLLAPISLAIQDAVPVP
jgi:Flp pilus assembly pilin Flp